MPHSNKLLIWDSFVIRIPSLSKVWLLPRTNNIYWLHTIATSTKDAWCSLVHHNVDRVVMALYGMNVDVPLMDEFQTFSCVRHCLLVFSIWVVFVLCHWVSLSKSYLEPVHCWLTLYIFIKFVPFFYCGWYEGFVIHVLIYVVGNT